MAKLIIFLLAAVIFVTIVSCHPGHKNKEQVQKVHKKKHGGHVSHGHHKHQMESERQEDEIYAMEEAKQVIESLDDLSSAVQSVSLAVENGVNYRGNEIGKFLIKPISDSQIIYFLRRRKTKSSTTIFNERPKERVQKPAPSPIDVSRWCSSIQDQLQ